MVFGASADKDAGAMMGALGGAVDGFIVAPFDGRRSSTAAALLQSAPAGIFAERAVDARAALEQAKARAGREGAVVVAGSIFLIAELYADFAGLEAKDDGLAA